MAKSKKDKAPAKATKKPEVTKPKADGTAGSKEYKESREAVRLASAVTRERQRCLDILNSTLRLKCRNGAKCGLKEVDAAIAKIKTP